MQIDIQGERIGRRHPVDHAIVDDAGLALTQLLPRLECKDDSALLEQWLGLRDRRDREFLEPPAEERLSGGLER